VSSQRPFRLFLGCVGGVGALGNIIENVLRGPKLNGANLRGQRVRDTDGREMGLVNGVEARFSDGGSELWLSRRRLAVCVSTYVLFFVLAAMFAPSSHAQAPSAASFATKIAQHTSTVGKADTFTPQAKGNPPPTITVDSKQQLPNSVTFSAPNLDIGATTPAGEYTITFIATNTTNGTVNTATQQLTLTVKPAAAAATKNNAKAPCDNDTYTVRLRALQGGDADGLAAALNSAFDRFSIVPEPEPSSSNGSQPSGDSPGGGPSQANSPPPDKFLCVYLRDTANPQTGKLSAFTPAKPTKPPRRPAVIPQDQSDLQNLIQKFDRSEFAGIGLDGRFLVRLSLVTPSDLISAFPAPAPGLELSSDDVVGQHYLILHPASTELQFSTKAGSDLATQAAKVKHDFLALDSQLRLIVGELANPQPVNDLVHAVACLNAANFPAVEASLERWDAAHTVHLAVLDPREVALALGDRIPGREVQVLAEQQAITIRPAGLGPQKGILFASDAIEREAIYERIKAEKTWQQTLQSDGGSNAKQSSGNSSQQPVTQTNSTTTITTPQASASAATKTAPALQVQTKTSTQTTSPPNATSGNSAQGSSGNAAQPSSGTSSGGSNTGSNASTGTPTGSGGAQGSGGGSGGGSSASQTPQATQAFPTGTVVRLFHLRQASNIATVLNVMAPGPGSISLVQPLADFGNDDLLLILPPAAGQSDNTESLRRMIASLDEPRPTVSLQVWSYEISSEKGTNPDDRRSRIGQAEAVSDAYGQFTNGVQEADRKLQGAMAAGMAAAMSYANAPQSAGAPFFDDVFQAYLTEKFENCIQSDRYCLGYENALTFPGPVNNEVNDKTNVTLERFVILLAAAKDNQAQTMIDRAVGAMNGVGCEYPRSGDPELCFDDFNLALSILAQRRNLHEFRAGVLDFLFQYKMATEYPNDFAPYYLERSAQNVDGFLSNLITALDRDMDRYLHAELEQQAQLITRGLHRRVGVANYGEVQVAAISGDAANVSGVVNNYFDITQPALLKDVLSGLLSGAGGSSSGGGAGQSTGSGGSSGGTSGSSAGTGSGSSGSTTTSGGSGSTGATGALASAAKLLTPWQAVALNALATASAPPQLMAQINAQTTLAVTPISLDTASAAELNLSLQISNPTTTVDASKGAPSSFVRQDQANSIANYSVQTKVRVDSLKLFQVSSLSMDLTHAQSPVPVPLVGWAWDAVFGSVPVMKDVFAFPRAPKTIQNRSIAVVRAVVVPTAMDLGLSVPFRNDRITDPVTGTSKSLSSSAQTSNKLQEFHQDLMHCVLAGDNNCLTEIRLSEMPEQTY
jgi:hypothetical protein